MVAPPVADPQPLAVLLAARAVHAVALPERGDDQIRGTLSVRSVACDHPLAGIGYRHPAIYLAQAVIKSLVKCQKILLS
jgi:uncharacterized membrane protein